MKEPAQLVLLLQLRTQLLELLAVPLDDPQPLRRGLCDLPSRRPQPQGGQGTVQPRKALLEGPVKGSSRLYGGGNCQMEGDDREMILFQQLPAAGLCPLVRAGLRGGNNVFHGNLLWIAVEKQLG